MDIKNVIKASCEEVLQEIIDIREDIHAHPEIGYELSRTASIVERYLRDIGIQVKTGVGKIGVVGEIIMSKSFDTIALRADMDALEIKELGSRPYKSKCDGKAHLCGHDAHTAMLLGTAKVIYKLKYALKVNVRFIFQPSEEQHPSGAKAMIEEGALDGVTQIYAIHVDPEHNEGHISIIPTIASSNTDFFSIVLKGKGGHAASPHLALDPIVLASKFILDAQCVISRNINPFEAAVMSFTQIVGGSTNNSIPEIVTLKGTVRTFSLSIRDFIKERLEKILQGVCGQEDAEYELDYKEYCPSIYNHPAAFNHALLVAKAIIGDNNVTVLTRPSMGGEDFAYYSKKVPACMIGLGIRNEKKGIIFDCHSPNFDLDSATMLYGIIYNVGLVFVNTVNVLQDEKKAV